MWRPASTRKAFSIEVNNGAGSDPTENPDGTFVPVELFSLLERMFGPSMK